MFHILNNSYLFHHISQLLNYRQYHMVDLVLEKRKGGRGSSSGVAAASKSCKKILILSELRLLQVALISKSMGIKSPAVDLLCIQENRTTIIQFKRTMNVRRLKY